MEPSQLEARDAPRKARGRVRRLLSGLLVTGLVLAVTELTLQLGWRMQNPELLWLVAVTFSAYQGGCLQGLLSAAVIAAYAVRFHLLLGGSGSFLDRPNELERVVVVAIVSPAIALMVGALKRRTTVLARRQAAVQSLQRVGELLHDVDVIVWEADAETWQFSFVSRGAEKILGHPIQDWHVRPDFWRDIVHPDDRATVESVRMTAISERRDHDLEYRAIAGDGRVVWLRDIVRVVPASALHRRPQLRGVMVDITAHKQEESLKAARRRVLEVIASAGSLERQLNELVSIVEGHLGGLIGAILLIDADDERLRWAAAPSVPEALLHRRPAPHEPASWCSGVAASRGARVIVGDIETSPLWERDRDIALASHLRSSWSQPIISCEGSLLGAFTAFHRHPGAPSIDELQLVESVAHAAGIAIQRQRSEAAVSQSLSLLRATLESTADGILVVDLSGRTVSANRKFMEMWRMPENVVTARRDGEVLQWALSQLKDPDGFECRLRELYEHPELESFDLVEFKDGRVFERFSQPQKIEGVCVGRVWSFRDITSRRRAEEALHEREVELRQAQKLEAIGLLAGGVAHDFNNLLTGILGYSDLTLKVLADGDPLRRNIEEIHKGAERAALLTRQLLAFGRKQVMQPKVIDLNEVVVDISDMLRRTIGEHIDLITARGPEPLRVRADPGQIEQVIMNLGINARDAMPRGGKLIIETARLDLVPRGDHDTVVLVPGSYAVLAVSDTGIGMDEATSARIFEPFFTTKEMGRGTGLGLATVYGIVTQSGGNISVDSEPGLGTTFRIYLPRVEDCIEQGAALPAVPPIELRGCETVLLIEDEPSVRQLVSKVLHDHGYTVLDASDGGEAIELCRRHAGTIDLVVTDVVMPRMSGQDLARRLVALRPRLKVLCISGYAEGTGLRAVLQELGAAFMQKPFTPDALARKVRGLLDAGDARPVLAPPGVRGDDEETASAR